ncbi:outer membrane protein assembly factor BamE [Kaistia dalseonensis]|uniref:Outer membrane protein assembly factor BamE (Lipoprotein component of BamABCDE complex) n=1 Tax=Kaistia dalseonensis TaxID=410840 RepID=A0ABU0H1K4_9HYPH|nr:outer membrane protein assembly factor BamE [Kaistia dalseonensis]MCX5493629.1 outer membrane protein assembly factor BamE [Kaistia dalseonensis]MDQ0436190.1 outer membrane protein assembly factor BamE (lipoprotein component of BamABCDE complex) [Kaistia dalseonensis]
MPFGVTDQRFGGSARARRITVGMLAVFALVPLAGCLKSNTFGGLNETYHAGYVASSMALEQVPVGASRDQVLIVLGSPSTTADFGGEVFYYISQTRKRTMAFQRQKIVDQRILAVYFDKNQTVARIANYGLKDGKVFDFITQTTPTSGTDQGFLEQVLTGTMAMGGGNPFGG